ncbi:hypothetical protein AB2B38_007715 [Balneola sp. MJW-20]|uniref:hypothetical protein n=1 Tax=Gracilimonas aurantiaca TaxID=3234185 RepID=UPI003466C874
MKREMYKEYLDEELEEPIKEIIDLKKKLIAHKKGDIQLSEAELIGINSILKWFRLGTLAQLRFDRNGVISAAGIDLEEPIDYEKAVRWMPCTAWYIIDIEVRNGDL